MYHRPFFALAAIAVTAGMFVLAAPAQAAAEEEQITISLAGLDAADPADARRIEARIRNGARDLCGSRLFQPVKMMQEAATCEESIRAEARGALDLARARRATPFRLTLRTR